MSYDGDAGRKDAGVFFFGVFSHESDDTKPCLL